MLAPRPADDAPAGSSGRGRMLLSEAAHAALSDELARLRRFGCDPADGRADARIAALEDLLLDATVIAEEQRGGVVSVGCAVDVEYPRTGRRARYRLVGVGVTGTGPADVSARSPVGQALMGARVDELVRVELPSGSSEALRVLAIDPEPAA